LDRWLATLIELEQNCILPFIILTFCFSEFVKFLIGYSPPFSHIRTFPRGEDEQGRGGARVVADSDMRGLVEFTRWAKTSAWLAHSHGPDEARVWAAETEVREELMRGRV
jgi:hypothetical protein